jgi:outer membrane protein TolC
MNGRSRPRSGAIVLATFVAVLLPGAGRARLAAQVQLPPPAGETLELTLDRMVELGLRDSYRVRQLRLEVDRTRSLLEAERAGLKSRLELDVAAPQFQAITENKWNSVLERNELIAENTRRVQMDLSLRQPVILFGYPTNGVLSLNNRVYRYDQIDGDEKDVRYYNRYFIGYQQPLFQPNRMKNDLEEAQLNFETSELDYQEDVVGMIDDLAGDYYEMVEDAFREELAADVVADLEAATAAARDVIAANQSRKIEADQLQVALANAREDVAQARSNTRLGIEEVKQRLRLRAADTVVVKPVLDATTVSVDPARAVQLARTLAPRIRQLEISQRENQIRLEETKGSDAFRVDLNFTYGREVQDPLFRNLWFEPRNSYTFDVRARVPIWDWGERRHRIQAQLYSLERAELQIEEAESDIDTQVRSQVRNLQEYEQRLRNMEQNLTLARQVTQSTIDRYRSGEVALVDLLQTLEREATTAGNFLEAYLGYKRSLLRLQELTFYDFERDVPLAERWKEPGSVLRNP